VNPGTDYGSISMSSATRAVLHSKSQQPCIHTIPITFCETLESYGDPSLWENLSYDGNGECSIRKGSFSERKMCALAWLRELVSLRNPALGCAHRIMSLA
jgi:hypothetical protein